MRACEFISEAFDNPYKSRKGRTRTPEQAAQYIFWIKNSLKRYRVFFHKANDNSNAIGLEFARDSIFGKLNFGRTNDLSTKQAVRVFATIADILKKFLAEFPEVNEIYFEGLRTSKETIETAKRIKLYKILAVKMSKELGFPNIEQEVIPDPKPDQPPIGIGFKLRKGDTWSMAGPSSSSIPKSKKAPH